MPTLSKTDKSIQRKKRPQMPLTQKSELKEKDLKKRVMKSKIYRPRSYRLEPNIVNILNDMLDKINAVSHRKVSETRLVKALICLRKE